MLYYVYFTDNGAPKEGLTPTWATLLTAENGTDKSASAPAINELGGGLYNFDITFGAAPWDVMDEDLLGVIDGGSSLANVDRYKFAAFTLRGLALARIAHKGLQNKSTGVIDIYATDGVTRELKLDMAENDETIARTPSKGD